MRAAVVVVWLGLAATVARAQPPPPGPPSSDPAAPPRIAIVVEVAVGIAPERSDRLASSLAAALTRQLVVEARGGAAVVERLAPAGLADGCLAQPACVTDVARRLDVDELLFIALIQLGDQLQVDVSWTDASGQRTVSRPRIVLGPGDVEDDVFRGRAVTLLPEARLRPQPTPDRRPPPGRGRHLSTTTWTLAAVTGVGLAAGIGLGLSTRSAYLACERDGCDVDQRQSVRTRAILADASFVVATGAAIAGAVLYARSAPAVEGRVRLDVLPGNHGATFVLGGRF